MNGCAASALCKEARAELLLYLRLAQGEREMNAELPYEIYEISRHE